MAQSTRQDRFTILVLCLVALSCSSSTSVDDVAEEDGISPSGVSDLAVVAFTDESITLVWTAPGDDSTSGTATAYDIRHSFVNNLWSDWDSAEVVTLAPTPKPAGSAESLTVMGLLEDSTYYFALRARDEEDNWSFISNVVSAACYTDFVVDIEDANLEAAIRATIGKPGGDIYRSDLVGMENLEAEQMGIHDLSGLEHCTGLQVLIVVGNEIKDLSPLAGLTALWGLDASDNDIDDIAPLAGLTGLQQLSLSENVISDISALEGLDEIRTLRLQENLLTDVAPLGNMSMIEYLNLSWNGIADIGPLVANSGLGTGDQVHLHVNPLSFESVTTHIPALQARGVEVHWDIDEAPPADVSDLMVGQVSETSVTLTWTAPGDDGIWGTADAYEVRYGTDSLEVSGWDEATVASGAPAPQEAGMAELMEISGLETSAEYHFALKTRDESGNWSGISNLVRGTPFVDVVVVIPDAGLEAAIRDEIGLPAGDIHRSDLFSILDLTAGERGISDLTGLEHCINIAVLDLHKNDIADIAPLSGLTRLTNLNVDDNSVSNISPLAGLTGLEWLSLRNNEITGIEPLAGLGRLRYLFCSGNSISDLDPLAGLTGLYYFEAMNNSIGDISALSGLTFLSYVFLSINPVGDLGSLTGLANLRYVFFDYAMVSDLTPLAGLPDVEKISVRYNQIADIAPLVANPYVAAGDEVWLDSNPLSQTSIDTHIPTLETRGVTVHY